MPRGLRWPAEKIFWSQVEKDGPELVSYPELSPCWIWGGNRNRSGHGTMTINYKIIGVHRYSYELHNGPIPDGLFVLHKCDNPPCVNPDHLFVGTQADNVEDSKRKGRRAKGSRMWKATLTDDQVRLIRSRYVRWSKENGFAAIARDLGVDKQAVRSAALGLSWSHLERDPLTEEQAEEARRRAAREASATLRLPSETESSL
jgi:hypothetical protein